MSERMLLYTKVAAPKVPKKRSRAGCTFCKEKKKKCDETRPSCARCSERGLDCSYEAVRPRQRRKRDSTASASSPTITTLFDRRLSLASSRRWSQGSISSDRHDWYRVHGDRRATDASFLSPLETSFDVSSTPILSNLSCTLSPVTVHDWDQAVDFDEDDEDYLETVEPSTSRAVTHISRPPDLAMIAPCPVGSPLLDFHIPAFSEFSNKKNRRALVSHFCDQLSHLVVFREETGNPFTQLVLPLTHKSQPVENAIYALASAHLEYRGVKNKEQSLHFASEAIQGLSTMIEDNQGTTADRNELLAAIMLLVYYEVLVQKGQPNSVDGHLRGAMAIMNSFPPATDPTGMFLERAFRFYDVIAALSFGTAPLSQAPGRSSVQPLPPTGAPIPSRLSSVDTLLGMSTTLWPIIHRLSKLSCDKADLEAAYHSTSSPSSLKAVLKTEFETNSRAIERELELWQPQLPADFDPDDAPSSPLSDDDDSSATPPPNDKARLHSIFNNAMAYRHSCFVYLYRSISGHARSHAAVQAHAHAALSHALRTCAHAGPMGALLWPLFVAACEAVTACDRALARRAFGLVEKRQGMINIKWAWEIVQEVWRQADLIGESAGEGEEKGAAGSGGGGGGGLQASACVGDFLTMDASTPHLWRRVSEQMGISIVFG